jgi:dTDP-3-amino-2,3,6-trideoxy-4-keto-D-glucose/dTDP-3-amino-3,4,6-trideoxy-alpha-D-glucose/dTDP-2,6-dideoxy-D-kanosamine transaminase
MVRDLVAHTASRMVLRPVFAPDFAAQSCGFRPERDAAADRLLLFGNGSYTRHKEGCNRGNGRSMSRIAIWDYREEYASEREELLAAVDKAFGSGQLVLGESVAAFEREFARYCGAAHAVGVDNGTNALTLALMALGIRAGDEVVTVANTAPPTVVGIRNSGATVRLVDIDPATYLMDVSALERAAGPKCRCIVPVHLYGQCVDMTAVESFAGARGIPVLEDCAQAHGADWQGRRAGSMGVAAGFSFYPTKALGAYGDGGAILTRSAELCERLRRLRYYGMGDRHHVLENGLNARLDEVQAEILRRKLTRLEQYIERRQLIAERYRERLSGSALVLPAETGKGRHTWSVYVVRHPKRDAIMAGLRENDIHVNISYPWPIHLMKGFADLGYREGSFPESEAAANEIFSLPLYPTLSAEAQDRVCEVLLRLLKEV